MRYPDPCRFPLSLRRRTRHKVWKVFDHLHVQASCTITFFSVGRLSALFLKQLSLCRCCPLSPRGLLLWWLWLMIWRVFFCSVAVDHSLLYSTLLSVARTQSHHCFGFSSDCFCAAPVVGGYGPDRIPSVLFSRFLACALFRSLLLCVCDVLPACYHRDHSEGMWICALYLMLPRFQIGPG